MIALLLACCLSAPAEVTVSTEKLTLGSILPFEAGDPRAAISLGYAPNAGLARRFTRQEILSKVLSAGLKTDDLQLPDSVLVRRLSHLLDRDRVTEAVLEALQRDYPNSNATVFAVDVPPIQTPAIPNSVVASLPATFDSAAPVFARIDIRGPGFYRQVFVRAEVQLDMPQPVIVAPISAHAIIRSEDIEWRDAPIGDPRSIVDSIEMVAGLAAKRDLRPGEILTLDMLYSPLFVKKGNPVTVRSTSGAVTVAATMRAKASGRLGETISLEHLSGAGTTMARVIGPDLLEVLKGAK